MRYSDIHQLDLTAFARIDVVYVPLVRPQKGIEATSTPMDSVKPDYTGISAAHPVQRIIIVLIPPESSGENAGED